MFKIFGKISGKFRENFGKVSGKFRGECNSQRERQMFVATIVQKTGKIRAELWLNGKSVRYKRHMSSEGGGSFVQISKAEFSRRLDALKFARVFAREIYQDEVHGKSTETWIFNLRAEEAGGTAIKEKVMPR